MNKILLISDLHLRHDTPQGRIDNFKETMLKKLSFVLETAMNEEVDLILQAGDFFNKPDPPISLLNELISVFKEFNIPIRAIYGQHDMYMRSDDIYKTAMGLFEQIGLIELGTVIHNKTAISTVSFGAEVPNVQFKDKLNILVIHAMIGNKPLYPGQELTDAGKFLKDNNYDIILAGDYHYPFHITREGRHIINTGCMLRMTRDERDMNRIPHFYILNVESRKLEKFNIPCESPENVFSKIKEKQENETIMSEGELLRFIKQLRQRSKSGISYLNVLEEYYEKNDIDEETKQLIAGVLNE